MTQTGNVVDKTRKTDVILVLKAIEGKGKDSAGLLDKDLFTGGNRLHAIMDTQTCLWSMRYDRGILPQPLKQQWTSYSKLMDFVTQYMQRRNVEIVEIID